MKNHWYEENIEEPIREIVKLLRDNGFNTECSCGHDMTVQCQYIRDNRMMELAHLLHCHMREKGQEPDFKVVLTMQTIKGHLADSLHIYIGDNVDHHIPDEREKK